MGLNYRDTELDYGWPLSLGTAEVRLYDMIQAFSVFANIGKKRPIRVIKKVTNTKGDILEEAEEIIEKEDQEVLDPQIAYLIANILSDETVKVGPKLGFSGFTAAAKTGTSTKEHATNKQIRVPSNLWTVGFTTHITAGVWAGNSNDAKTGNLKLNANGYDAASGMWQKFMIAAHKDKKNQDFPRPEGIKSVKISSATGKLPGPQTPSDMIREDLFASFAVPTEVDNTFVTVRVDKATGARATADCPDDVVEERTFRNHQAIDPSRKNWQDGIRAWAGGSEGAPPPEGEYQCSKDKQPSIIITNPSTYSRLKPGNIPVSVSYEAPFGVQRIDYFLDDQLVYTDTSGSNSGIIRLSDLHDDGSKHIIIAKIFDQRGLQAQSVIEVTVDNSTEEEPPAEAEEN